jgi:hypothetical protein
MSQPRKVAALKSTALFLLFEKTSTEKEAGRNLLFLGFRILTGRIFLAAAVPTAMGRFRPRPVYWIPNL